MTIDEKTRRFFRQLLSLRLPVDDIYDQETVRLATKDASMILTFSSDDVYCYMYTKDNISGVWSNAGRTTFVDGEEEKMIASVLEWVKNLEE